MKEGRIAVFGGINIDLVINCPHLPKPGETVKGYAFHEHAGGKGANQAVAAAKLGGTVSLLGHIGGDPFGQTLLENLKRYGIDTSCVRKLDGEKTGIALIFVDDGGENIISFFPGANMIVEDGYLDIAAKMLSRSDILLIQMECSLPVVFSMIRIAASLGVKVILNPAPAVEIPDDIVAMCSVIIPNESEVEILTHVGIRNEHDALMAATMLRNKGCETVIVTMGEQGAFVSDASMNKLIPPPSVKAIDTVAAGDVFCGAFAVKYNERAPIGECIRYANCAAAISTTRRGAQSSIPDKEEVIKMMKNMMEVDS